MSRTMHPAVTSTGSDSELLTCLLLADGSGSDATSTVSSSYAGSPTDRDRGEAGPAVGPRHRGLVLDQVSHWSGHALDVARGPFATTAGQREVFSVKGGRVPVSSSSVPAQRSRCARQRD